MTRQRSQIWALTILMAGAGLAAPIASRAQGVRGEISAGASYFEYRAVVRKSVAETDVPGDGTTRELPDGTIVTCVPGGDCYWYEAGEEESATTLTQDLRLVAWPGNRGLSSRVHLRGRFGSNVFWPRTDREFEALTAYVDFERTDFRVRAGRQDRLGALGVHYFDGGAVLWRGWKSVRLEAFAGRSLARTLIQPRTKSLLEETDDLPPDEESILWGAEGRLRLGNKLSGSLLYQRELRTDREGLYSERLAFDARLSAVPATVELSTEFNIPFGEFNKAHLRLRRGLRPNLSVQAEARHYRPFFELWTIWGAFSPVGYTEGRASAFWDVVPGLTLEAGGAYREYEETNAGAEFLPIEGDGWRAHGSATWAKRSWSLRGGYTLYSGYGAYRSSLDAALGRSFGTGGYVGVFGQGTQQFSEFRFGEGQTGGAGLEARIGLRNVMLNGNIALYRQTFDERPGFSDYNQIRGRLGLTWKFGTEPKSSGYGRSRS